MRRNRTAFLLAVLGLTLILSCAYALSDVLASAHGYTLGAADGSTDAAPIAAQMGAKTYRVVMDPNHSLDYYAPQIEAYRAQGMRPQLVIGGGGTDVRGKTGPNWQIINYAIHAFKRWPDAYSVSVVNEPKEAGVAACQYAKTYRRAYKMLKAAGVPRVLFGELSPHDPMGWTDKMLKCSKTKVIADGWAWHCYDNFGDWVGIRDAAKIKAWLKAKRSKLSTPRGFSLPMFCTEYGVMTRGEMAYGEQDAAKSWTRALRIAKAQGLAQIVAWGIDEVHADSRWDTSLRDRDGRFRPAFDAIASA